MTEDAPPSQFRHFVASVLADAGVGAGLDDRGRRGPFEELAFVVRGEEVVLLCSQWETIAVIAHRIRWEFEGLPSRVGRDGLADLVRSITERGVDRSGHKLALVLASGERLVG